MSDRIEMLEREIEALRARVDALVGGAQGRCSLRLHARCPVCDNRSVLRIERIADRGDGLTIAALAPLVEQGLWSNKPIGQFVIYVCRQCGLAEWYVAEVGDIPLEHPSVELTTGEAPAPGSGPFR